MKPKEKYENFIKNEIKLYSAKKIKKIESNNITELNIKTDK